MTEAAQEVVQTTEDVLGALEAGQERHPRAGQPYNGLQIQHLSLDLSPPSQSYLTVQPHEKGHRMQV